ncbi:DUF2283 domain-containing protein [Nocardia abscessus]|uniref:DUF2283 domain-containing protein n=2 Tax=Nocardia abscessus TaxID=120957 RepID=UPI002454137D|nr:DUF2283 domain-containing protein [Nocardia abscessus]
MYSLLPHNYDKESDMKTDYLDYLTWDEQHNIAYLAFRQNSPEARHAARTLRVHDQDSGEIVAALDFGDEGELIGVELLNANVQLSAALKRKARAGDGE